MENEQPINIRPITAGDVARIARLHVDTWRVAYRGIFPDEVLINQTYEKREAQWRDLLGRIGPQYIALGAFNGNEQAVGFVDGGKARDQYPGAELNGLFVHPNTQGQGVGSKLMLQFARWLKSSGFESMRLWTPEGSQQSRTFYESAGGIACEVKEIVLGKAVNLISYRWDSLDQLIFILEKRG